MMRTCAGCFVLGVTLWLSCTASAELSLPAGKITLKAVDEEGVPVKDAHAEVAFTKPGKKIGMGTQSLIVGGLTDSNGLFTAEAETLDDIAFIMTKTDYYKSYQRFFFKSDQDGKWQPWEPVITMVVRRVENPIPMYAKRVETKIPTTNDMFGFDLERGDWVRPVGAGIIADFVFSIKGFWRNYRENDSMLKLSFSNQADGVIPIDESEVTASSVLMLPRYAHETGYQNIFTWRRARSIAESGSEDEIIDDLRGSGDYFFRIRSETNDMGIVTNAYYGKIRGKYEFVGAADDGNGSWLKFTYYLNPTPNDRNMEFDPKQNLFKNLKSTEEVTAP